MPSVRFNSTHLQDADYDEDTGVLTITFRYQQEQYEYDDVPVHVYNALAATPYPGDFFRSVIKGKFPTRGPF